jgi:hypothetical protein
MQSNGWGGDDVSLIAGHLLSGSNRTIVDWTYQRLPYSVVWAVRDDGVLLSLTYSRGTLTSTAWARHDTDGSFESVCSVPEGNESALYAVVRRTISGTDRRYIERMATRQVLDVQLGCFLDASVWYSGAPAQDFGDLDHLEGKTVYALVDGVKQGPFTVAGGIVHLTSAGSSVFIGLPYFSDVELLDLTATSQEIGPETKNVHSVCWEVDRTAGLQAGEDFANLVPWRPDVGDAFDATGLSNGKFVVPIGSSWNRGGRAVLRQADPLPVTVLGVTRDVELGAST